MYFNKEDGKLCLDALLFSLRHYSHSPQRDAFSMVTLVVTLCSSCFALAGSYYPIVSRQAITIHIHMKHTLLVAGWYAYCIYEPIRSELTSRQTSLFSEGAQINYM